MNPPGAAGMPVDAAASVAAANPGAAGLMVCRRWLRCLCHFNTTEQRGMVRLAAVFDITGPL